MLLTVRRMQDLSFSSLMEVYAESNLKKAKDEWKHLPEQFALQQAEQDFYHYLKEVFFRTPDACYLIWQEDARYISALRLEPYRDGFLLAALETCPDRRRQGYGKRLINALLQQFPGRKIYSHVHKQNTASLTLHQACGFQKALDHAVYIDGSVDRRACTLLHE